MKRLYYILGFVAVLSAQSINTSSLNFVGDYSNDGIGTVDFGTPSSVLQLDSAVTVEIWVKLNEYPSWKSLINSQMYSLMIGSDGSVTFHWNDGNWQGISTNNGSVPLDTWTHLAGVRDENNNIQIYINGLLAGEGVGSTPVSSSSLSLFEGGNGTVAGSLDEFRIWNYNRSQDEIQLDMNHHLIGDEAGLVGYWKINEGAGSDIYDLSGNENDGIIHGGTWDENVPFYYSHVIPTGLPYNIIVESVMINDLPLLLGDQIGIFDDTLCVGSYTILDTSMNINIVTWEGDTEYNLPGFSNGNMTFFKIFSRLYGEGESFIPDVAFSLGNGTFGDGTYSVVALEVNTNDLPELSLNTNSIHYDPTPVWTVATDSLVFQNIGTRNLTIFDILVSNTVFNIDFSEQLVINPGENFSIPVTFNPSEIGYFSDEISIIYNDAENSPYIVEITGVATQELQPEMSGFSDAIHLNEIVIGDTAGIEWAVQNTGNDTLNVWDIYISDYHFSIDLNAFTLAPGGFISIPIEFIPDSRGLFSTNLYFSHNAPNVNQNWIELTGIGFDGHFQPVEPTGLPYTIIVDSILVDFQELNYGEEIGVFSDSLCVGIGIKGVAGNIQIISWEEEENYGLQGFSTGDSITFKFWGERYDENREADLFTSFTIGNGLFGFQPMTVVDLTGSTGYFPEIESSENELFFNPTVINNESTKEIIFSNNGNTNLYINGLQFSSPIFNTSQTSFIILPDTSVSLLINFQPIESIFYSETLLIESNDYLNNPIEVYLEGMGLPELQSYLRLASTSLNFEPTIIGDTLISEIIVFNDGNTDLSLYSVNSTSSDILIEFSPVSINPGSMAAVPVKFHPSQIGINTGMIEIFSDNAANGNYFYINANGIGYEGYFDPVNPTGLPYHIVIDSISTNNDSILNVGDEIGIFDNELCVGVGIVRDSSSLSCIVWENDESYGLPGFTNGDSIVYLVKRSSQEDSSSDQNIFFANPFYMEGNGYFGTGELSTVQLDVTEDELAKDIELATSYIDLGGIQLDSIETNIITIFNVGNFPLTVFEVTNSNQVFSFSDSSFIIAPNDSVQLIISFQTTTVGAFNDTLTLLSDDLDETDKIKYVYLYAEGIDSIAPGAPLSVSSQIYPQMITINWARNNESDLEKYFIYKGVGAPSDSVVSEITDPDTIYIDTNVVRDVEYYYYVSAVDTNDNISLPSDTIMAIAVNSPPTALILTDLSSEVHGGIPFQLLIEDIENDDMVFDYFYSTDSLIWNSATIFDITYNNTLSISDTLSFTWQSVADIGENDVRDVFLKINSFDAYDTTSIISESIHIDNYVGYITMNPQLELDEYTGNIDFDYSIIDTTNDIYSLLVTYSVDNGNSWNLSSISGMMTDLDSSLYSDTLKWSTLDDLMNYEGEVFITLMLNDGWQNGQGDTIALYLDNQFLPTLFTAELPAQWYGPIQFTFNKEIDYGSLDAGIIFSSRHGVYDDLEIEYDVIDYSLNINNLSQGGWFSGDTLDIEITTDLKDIYGNPFDGNGNDDPDSTGDDTLFTISIALLGDYDNSDFINFDDLITFQQLWFSDSVNAIDEIGPAEGTPPYFQVIPDQHFDFEDLMVFVQMWNWSTGFDYGGGLLARTTNSTNEDLTMEISYPHLNNEQYQFNIELNISDFSDVGGMELVVQFDTADVMFNNIISHTDESWVKLIHENAEEGTLILNMADLNENVRNLTVNPIKLHFTGKKETQSTLEWQADIRNRDGDIKYSTSRIFKFSTTAPIPQEYALHQNYPNPFNPTTTIRYDLPEDAQVYLVIYNILGQEVTTLISEKQPAGFHRIIWDSKNQFGKPVSPGIYFYLLKTNHFSDSKKLVLLK